MINLLVAARDGAIHVFSQQQEVEQILYYECVDYKEES